MFNDILMNLPERLPGLKGWVTRLIGSTGGPKVTRTARFIIDDRAAYADPLRRLSRRDGLARLIVSHGAIVEDDPARVLEQVAAGCDGSG